jgi:hypothetical protein
MTRRSKYFTFIVWLLSVTSIRESVGQSAVIGGTLTDGVVNSALYAGSDIGAKVNAAIAAIGCGTVLIPAGTYSYTTTILKPRCINLTGHGAVSTHLNYTATTGVAVVIGDAASPTQYGIAGISGISFAGTGTGLGTTNTSVGIWIGGDPFWGSPCGGSGTSGIIPCNYSADNQTFYQISVSGFEIGVKTANNAYVDTFTSTNIFANWYGISQAPSSTNSGENNRFVSSDIFNNSGAGLYAAGGWKLIGTSLDFNNDGSATTQATHAQVINTEYECHACHAEAYSGAVSTGNQPFSWYGGEALFDSNASITDPVFFSTSAAGQTSSLIGTNVYSGHTVSALVLANGGAKASIYISGLSGNGNAAIGVTLSSSSNVGFVFLDPKMQFIDGAQITVNGNLKINQSDAGYLDLINTSSSSKGIRLQPVGGGNQAFLGNSTWNLNAFSITASSVCAANGFTGTKVAGACILTISCGVITNVTGC